MEAWAGEAMIAAARSARGSRSRINTELSGPRNGRTRYRDFLATIDSRFNFPGARTDMAAIDTASGVSFNLTEEQKALRALSREFAEQEIRPRAAEYDEHATHPADV